DALGDRQADRRAVPAGRGAEGGQGLGGEVGAAHAGADHLVGGRPGGCVLEHELVGERHRLHDRHELVAPVGRTDRAEEQAEVDLARRALPQPHARSRARASARKSSGPRRSARASAGKPSCSSAARARSRTPGGAPGARASERASALRRWANAAAASARTSGATAGPRRRRTTRTESTLGTGVKTVRATGRRTRTSQAIWASTLGRP